MTVQNLKLITKTSGKLQDDFIKELSESRDWSEIKRNQKIDVEISNPAYLELFRIHGKRIYTLIDSCLTAAIERFYMKTMAQALVPRNPQELEKLIEKHIAGGAEYSRKTLVSQQETKLSMGGNLRWVTKYFSGILKEIKITPDLIKLISLSDVNAEYVGKLVCFDCNIDGVETQQAIPDKFVTEKSPDEPVFAERYDKDQHGGIRDVIFQDFQYYWLREPIKEFSRKKSLRKIAGQSFGKFVSRYETSDKVRVLGFYRITEKDKKNNSPAEDVEIEIINMEKLDDDVEVTLSKEEINKFKALAKESPEDFIKDFSKSCAPHIEGNDTAKLGIILSEVGPTDLVKKYRPHIHLYLTGNPGTAKSEMLKWFSKVSFMGVYADAPNASSRGLMYGQEEHGKRKILKAGLMVRNKKLYLDELDKMGETRQELNTAMEQQIASYHKNPFDIDTDIDCTVIAAGNPVFGKWKEGIDILEQLKPIKPELLSRFLIIRVIKSGNTRKRLSHVFDTMQNRDRIQPKFTEHQIAGLLNHCRTLNPPMSKEAEDIILDFAEMFEGIKQDEESNLDFEARAQINVIRISTAFAKFLQKEVIDAACARIAINFINECNRSLGMITEVPTVQSDLGGTPVNKDVAFLRIVKELQQKSDDDCFGESELINKMLELDQFWQSEDGASGYWRRHHPDRNPKSDYYQPHTGRFKKVS